MTDENRPRILVADSDELRLEAMSVRWDVFIVEQAVPMVLEIDARDMRLDVLHLAALDEAGRALGTVRVIPDGDHHFHLGRLAVKREARGSGLGAALVAAVHDEVACRTPRGAQAVVTLDAQVQAQGFYAAQGYEETTGEVFLDAGIEHREMRRILDGRA